MRTAALRTFIFGRSPKRTLVRVVVIVAVSYVLFGHLLLPVRGSGPSMSPTFSDGQIGFANRLAYVWGIPTRGDVIAIRMAGPRVVYVKRIVALPGERIRIDGGIVFINDRPLDEPYAAKGPAWRMREVQLDSAEYFVIGDNRRMSIERHDLGVARRDRIVGKMLF
jgi:signal peptidase I